MRHCPQCGSFDVNAHQDRGAVFYETGNNVPAYYKQPEKYFGCQRCGYQWSAQGGTGAGIDTIPFVVIILIISIVGGTIARFLGF